MRSAKTWLITDTHFGHKNIIEFCLRPFASCDDMHKAIIRNWNKYVMAEDLVFHLGDVSLSLAAEDLTLILRQLNGTKVLILGNHDHWKSAHWWMSDGRFHFATNKILHRGVWLTHSPASELPDGAYVNVHGHLHNNGHRPSEGGDKSFNKLLALENENYTPVDWEKWVPKDPYALVRI